MTVSEDVRSARLPGGSLLSALLDRQVMVHADRGGSSALIGDRWADVAAAHAESLVGSTVGIPGGEHRHRITRIVRLDDDPRIAHRASRNGLQNPDLLFIGEMDGTPTVQAVDAKFSIETARSKQVSPDMLRGLFGLGSFFEATVGDIENGSELLPGLFLSPDSLFTRHVLKRGRGIVRLTVQPDEMILIGVSAGEMFDGMDGSELLEPLYRIDGHSAHPLQNLLSGIYYFRLARAAIVLWIDQTRPLLAFNDVVKPNLAAVTGELNSRARTARSALGVITDWAGDVEAVSRQRAAIDRVAGIPVTGKDLREWIIVDAAALGAPPPSMNQVRKRLSFWFRSELRATLGPIEPPRHDLGELLLEIGKESRRVSPMLRQRTTTVVHELVSSPATEDDLAPDQMSRSDGESV